MEWSVIRYKKYRDKWAILRNVHKDKLNTKSSSRSRTKWKATTLVYVQQPSIFLHYKLAMVMRALRINIQVGVIENKDLFSASSRP